MAPGERFRRAVNRFLEKFDLEIFDTDEATVLQFPQWRCENVPCYEEEPRGKRGSNHNQRSYSEEMPHIKDAAYRQKSTKYKEEGHQKIEHNENSLHHETRSQLTRSQHYEPRNSRQDRCSPQDRGTPQAKNLEQRRSPRRERSSRHAKEHSLERQTRHAVRRDPSITPSESASIRMYKSLELRTTENCASTKNLHESPTADIEAESHRRGVEREFRRQSQQAEYRTHDSTTKRPEQREEIEHQEQTKDLMDNIEAEGESVLTGSAGDPPRKYNDHSVRIVEEWLEKCNESTRVRKGSGSDSHSMVSVLGCGVLKRPALGVPDWGCGATLGAEGCQEYRGH